MSQKSMDFDFRIAKNRYGSNMCLNRFSLSLLGTSCELLAKYEVIRAKTLLNRNEKPQNSIILGLWEPKIDRFSLSNSQKSMWIKYEPKSF